MKRIKTTNTRREIARLLTLQGHGITDIARVLGISRQAVYYLLKTQDSKTEKEILDKK
jgi:DNA-binding CsgD family transcriptional regulator